MDIEEAMMPIDEWIKQFSCKYMQQPISFLTEENLDRLQQHCEKTIQYENGRILEEHQVTLELIIRYRELQQKLEKEKKKNKKLEEDKNHLLIEGAKLVGDKEILKQTFKDSIKMFYIHKDKLRKIIYPSPENPIPIEVQQSEMYKKLLKEMEE